MFFILLKKDFVELWTKSEMRHYPVLKLSPARLTVSGFMFTVQILLFNPQRDSAGVMR